MTEATTTKKGWLAEEYVNAGGEVKRRLKWARRKLKSKGLPVPKVTDPEVISNSGVMKAAGDDTNESD